MHSHKIHLLILFLCAGLWVHGQASPDDKAIILTKGQMVPAFKFELSKGKQVSFNDYRGKIVLINFFATWCGPCRRELPLVQEQIWNKHQSNPKFAMLTFGREHSWTEVLKFGKDQHLTFPLFPDPSRKVFALFASESIPRSFLVDGNGKILFTSLGFEENQFKELKDLLDSLL